MASIETIESLPPAQLAELAAKLVALQEGDVVAPISLEDVVHLERVADTDLGSEQRRLVNRVAAWVDANHGALFAHFPGPTPPFDHLRDFWVNFYDGPRKGEVRLEEAPQIYGRPTRLLDFEVSFPFGVPACALTPQSQFIDYYAKHGFDLLTYKTVRDRAWDPHPFPQWGFVPEVVEPLKSAELGKPVLATLVPNEDIDVARVSLVNSFGVPSLPVEQWAKDIAEAKSKLSRGQVLIVSVMGSPEVLSPNQDDELARQFARAAVHASEAGADIIEVNLSCPNTGGELICGNADLSAAILQKVTSELEGSPKPVFAKISYLDELSLSRLVEKCHKLVRGIVAINAVMVPTHTHSGAAFFPSRKDAKGNPTDRAALSGVGIRDFGLDVARRLVGLRKQIGTTAEDWIIVGVGGVNTPQDFNAYLETGVEAVQSCSGAWLNPGLALEVRRAYGTRTPRSTLAGVFQAFATGGLSLLKSPEEAAAADPSEQVTETAA
jgi:dihydroorotate dehydrogenase (NAD+) catalytic subunit